MGGNKSNKCNSEFETENGIRSWFKWCPTSLKALREAEEKLLKCLTNKYVGKFVTTKCEQEIEHKIWTIILNENSKHIPLVLLHGFGAGVGIWCMNLDELSSDRPVYCFDILGFGRSSRPFFSSSADEAERQLMESIECWRKEIGIERFILLGHSMGGFLAASYALNYPNRVRHLILADPWGFPERPLDFSNHNQLPFWIRAASSVMQYFNPLSSIRAAGPLGPQLIKKLRPDLIKKFSPVCKDDENTIAEYLYHCNAQNPSGETAFHYMMENFGWAKNPMIKRIANLNSNIPITIIYGSRSWIDKAPGGQIKQQRNKSYVDVKILKCAGHHVYADKPHEFNSIVLNACTLADIDSNNLVTDIPSSEFHIQSSEDIIQLDESQDLNALKDIDLNPMWEAFLSPNVTCESDNSNVK